MKLVYLAEVRLPTEKAHGFQISKMCEAYARLGLDVILMHIWRKQEDSELKKKDLFDYYGIDREFYVKCISNLDVVQLVDKIPGGLFKVVYVIHGLLWGFIMALYARKERADVYYTRDVEVAFWIALLRMPVVLELHTVPKKAHLLLLKSISCKAELKLVVVLTSFIQKRLKVIGIPGHKIRVLPDGVDMKMYNDLPGRKECRVRLNLPIEAEIVGYVGRFRTLSQEKGIFQLIEAMSKYLAKKGFCPILLCVGGPLDIVPEYLDYASKVGLPEERLIFVDRVPNVEVPFWIRSCDAVVAPFPLNEHYSYFMSPLKIFEYMAAGAAIVASDLPSLREVLFHCRNSRLVEPGNTEALAENIHYVLTEKEQSLSLGNQARRDVQLFTWDNRAREVIKSLTYVR